MFNDHLLHIIQTITLSFVCLCLLSACSTVPYYSPATIIANPQLNSPNKTLGHLIVQTATSQLGVRYTYSGKTPKEGFDCSGLVLYSHHMHGIALPRTAAAQFTQGKPITRTQLNSGDLIFFKTRGQRVSHVGIYMGNGLFIHSPNNRKSVQTESLDNPYYKKHYVGARRYWSSESR